MLVRVDSVDTLRRAYPSYFADTALFLAELKNAIGTESPQRGSARGLPLA